MCDHAISHVHRIGIVDDDEAVRDAIHIVLETKGFQVSEYDSAQDYLLNPQEDCVLLVDYSMQELDGLALVELLRTGGIETPIVLMTDIAGPDEARRISAAGHCMTLQKPADSGALLAAIASSIDRAGSSIPG